MKDHFTQYRQLNGGNFLVCLKEVKDSEKILLYQILIKENINFFDDDISLSTENLIQFEDLEEDLENISTEIFEASLSQESEDIVLVVAGYVAKQPKEKTTCNSCISKLCGNEIDHNLYFAHLSRGGLIVPSATLAHFVSSVLLFWT